jgi:signal recognition particle GTPase
MNVNLIKSFVARTDLNDSEKLIKERILRLDGGIGVKRAELNELLSQIGNFEKSVNAKNAELFAEGERLAELCDLVIQMHPGEEVV